MAAMRKPARFSESTKAAKPLDVSSPSTTSTDCEDSATCAVESKSAATASTPKSMAAQSSSSTRVEVVVTPTKRRRIETRRDSDQDLESSKLEQDKAFVTPSKCKASSTNNAHFLPTPPITPTISISDHDVDDSPSQDSPSRFSSPALSSISTPSSSRSPSPSISASVEASSANIYARARALLRLSAHHGETQQGESSLVGRQAEREQLTSFLRCHLPALFEGSGASASTTPEETTAEAESSEQGARRAKAMYISGSPGTGKTALLCDLINSLKKGKGRASSGVDGVDERVRMTLLNCTSMSRSNDVWQRLAEELELSLPIRAKRGQTKSTWTAETFAGALATSPDQRFLVVLDEIDHLLPDATAATGLSASQTSTNVLSSLFAMALDPSSNLVLVGIANALDLTQRYQALLFGSTHDSEESQSPTKQAQCDPDLLHFRPFQSDEMVAIVKQRLNSLHDTAPHKDDDPQAATQIVTPLPLPVVAAPALELAAKKVAAVTGDLRSFLSLIRKAVELFEAEQRKRFLELESIAAQTDTNASPTKSILANKHKRKRATQSMVDDIDDSLVDPLARFDAITAPKLTPAHILKATRLVSLTSSSSANSRNGHAGSLTQGINSAASALSTASTNSVLQSKITELNLQQRLALTSFLILLARRIASKVPSWTLGISTADTIDIDVEGAAVPGGGVHPSELHALYKTLLAKEDLIHPVGSSEFSDLLSGLHTRGLLGLEREVAKYAVSSNGQSLSSLAPPMMRRTSSSSSVSSLAGSSPSSRSSRSPSPSSAKAGQSALYLLYPFTALHSALAPSTASKCGPSAPVQQGIEASTICSNLLSKESKRLKRIQKTNAQLEAERTERELAPRSGFNGDGLEDQPRSGKAYVGDRDRRGRNDQDDDDHEHESRQDTEEGAGA